MMVLKLKIVWDGKYFNIFNLLTLSITFYFVKSYTCSAFLFDLVFLNLKLDQIQEREGEKIFFQKL